MAVTTIAGSTGRPGEALHVREPRMRDFMRLKLRILANGLRGKGIRVFLFVLRVLGGFWAILWGFVAFAATSFAPPDTLPVFAAFVGTAVVLAWVFLPLLFFGVDETLDPARFALLPLRRRTLAAGMLAAACVGIPPVVTFVASLGSVVGAAVKGGAGPALVAVLGASVGILLCVVASRAVTSAFATMLRSRRVRDLAAIVLALVGVSCGPLQGVLFSVVRSGDTAQAAAVSNVLSWTPLAAPYVAYVDAIKGQWALVPVRLLIGLAGVGLLLWWWSRTIESAMLGASSGSAAKVRRTGPAGAVETLFPLALRGLPKTRFGALVAREVRYWMRETRRRAGLIALLAASVVIPFGLRFGFGTGGRGGMPLPIALGLAGLFLGTVLANQFGNDGTAYAAHLLAGVPGEVELRARAAALALLTLPWLLVVGSMAAIVTGAAGQLAAALGTVLGAFGVSVAVAGLTSVLVPYALPDSTNPFAVNTGSGSAKGMLSLVGMFASIVLTSPLVVAFYLVPSSWRWLMLPAGLLWGAGGTWLGTYIGGDVLDRRAPEVLASVTPRS